MGQASKKFERQQSYLDVSHLCRNSLILLMLPITLYYYYIIFSGVKSQEQTCITVLERDLSTVHPVLFSSLDDIGRSQVEQLLRRLGVKSWSARELINSHIIPTFKSGKWKVSHPCFYGQYSLAFRNRQVELSSTLTRNLELSVDFPSQLVSGFKAECLV